MEESRHLTSAQRHALQYLRRYKEAPTRMFGKRTVDALRRRKLALKYWDHERNMSYLRLMEG